MQKQLTINNLKINYYDVSEGDTTLLFLHGNSLGAETFIKQLDDEKLRQKFRMIAVDLPGYGGSQYGIDKKETYCFKGFASFLVSFIHTLKLENIVCIGHSAGGNYLLEAYSQLPDLKGIVLSGVTIDGKTLTETPSMLEHKDVSLFF